MDRAETLRTVALAAAVLGLVLMLVGTRVVARARAASRWSGQRGRVRRLLGQFLVGLALLIVAVAVAVLAGSAVTIAGPTWRHRAFQATVGLVALAVGGYAAARLVDRAELTALIRTPHVPGQPGRGGRRVVPTLDDPAVPFDGQAGWVYRDRGGAWYLAVAASMPDLTLGDLGGSGGLEPAAGPGLRTGTPGAALQVPEQRTPARPGGDRDADPLRGYRLVRLGDFVLTPVGAVRGPLDLAGSAEVRVLRPDDPAGGADDPDDLDGYSAAFDDPDGPEWADERA